MKRIEIKNDSYVIMIGRRDDSEVIKFLETEVEDIENIQKTDNGFSFEVYGEEVEFSWGQCLLVDRGYYIDVISEEAFEFFNN